MNATLRQLETLRTFILTSNMTETARLLNVTQSAVSQTLKELEGQLGFTMYVKNNSRIQVTPEAKQVLPDIERVLFTYATLQTKVGELRDARAGAISIVCRPSHAIDLLPQAILAFRKQRPHVDVHIEVSTRDSLARPVREEYVDLGLAMLPIRDPSIATQPLFSMSMMVMLPKGHRLAVKSVITPRDMQDENLILVRQEAELSSLVIQALGGEGGVRSVVGTNQSLAGFHLVRAGVGAAILHPLILPIDHIDDIVIRPFDPLLDVSVGLIFSRRRPMPRPTAKFISCLIDVTEGIGARYRARGIHFERLA
jgi:DNA-binding transcriptional LysR family regulator